MRSRWHHKPELHVPSHHEQGKKVTWLELFFDLVFVAGILQLGDYLAQDVSLGGLLAFAGHFVPLWVAWTGFTFYANRFNVDDLLHRLLALGTMLSLGAMAIASHDAMSGKPAMFALAYASAQIMISFLFLRSYWEVPESRAYSGYWGSMFAGGAVCFAVSAFVPVPQTYALWALGIGLIVTSPLAATSRALYERYPTDHEHLSERYGLLTIIVLGESFVKVLSYLTGVEDVGWEYLLKGFFNLILTYSIWWIYFDDVADSEVKDESGAQSIWVLAHIPLTLAITAVGVAVKLAIKFDMSEPAKLEHRWLLGGMLALTFVSVAVIDSVTERPNNELTERNRIYARLVSAALLLLICQVGGTMSSGVLLILIAGICLGQVAFDLMVAPLQDDHQVDRAVSMAVMSQESRDRSEQLQMHERVQEVVRIGAPTELRRDFYFFFIEGSWSRTLASFAFVYVFLNVLFAGLYQLSPGSISGEKQDFAEAFFFSVQTISSLGYGGITPATNYGNGVVTVEVAVGMLFAAMATGLMFAKLSRPTAGVMFSKSLVLTVRHGVPALMFRVANARGNEIVDATMTVSAMIDEISDEGHHMRRLHDIALVRNRSPVFTMSWLAIHEVDEQSVFRKHAACHVLGLIVTVMGHDGTYGQTVYARHMYRPNDILKGHRFVDVMAQMPDGRTVLDLGKFHDVEDDPEAAEVLARLYPSVG